MWYLCHFFLITLTVLLLLFFSVPALPVSIFIHFRPFTIPQYLQHLFYIFAFLLHIRITILFRYNILYGFYPSPFFLAFIFCIFLLDPFGYLSLQLSLTLPFYCLRVQLVFSHPPVTSLHLTSAIFKIFFLHHHT